MDQRRFSKSAANENLQKKLVENRRKGSRGQEQVPDIADFMNDMFFGVVKTEKKVYNLSGGSGDVVEEDDDFDSSNRSTSSRLTQEWLEEAKRLVASSPNRGSSRAEGNSPTRLVGSPRFGASRPRLSTSSATERNPLSRSARRNRSVDGFTGEILTKSVKHTHSRNNSQTAIDSISNPNPNPNTQPTDASPASAVQKWFSNILKPPTAAEPPPPSTSLPPSPDLIPPRASTHRRSRFENQSSPPPPPLPPISPSATITTTTTTADPSAFVPPRLSTHRRSRFQNDPNAAQPQLIPTTRRTTTPADNQILLSPPKHLHESAQRRSISSSTCSLLPEKNQILSPPRNLVESAQRRSISSSTCFTDKISRKPSPIRSELHDLELGQLDLNAFLSEQRIKILKLLKGEIKGKAKIVLSGHSNSTSSMVAAICYAWLVDARMRTKRNAVVVEDDGGAVELVVPVLNVRRGRCGSSGRRRGCFIMLVLMPPPSFSLMSVGLEFVILGIELEILMMNKQLSILVVGQEILKTDGEVGSKCTILTDNYCEDAYDLLQNPILKKLMLAGVLLDTQNLNTATTKDTEAARLLSVGSAPNYGNSLYDQLTQDQRDGAFFEALRQNYGKPPNENNLDSKSPAEERLPERKHQSPKTFEKGSRKDQIQAKPEPSAKPKPPTKQTPSPAKSGDAPREKGKNPFFLAKWFGFAK
ncbi:hypothetical protein OSB04_003853 [Centaurea solstitialis]|uniref:Uncharacterized protein n=1 Tax=Centaurea solstitialis TaxID=347529 RepID=A0AA38WNL2_9ASTR|nr:hypothetical protein OSB04_003853 [Centaurea solstitialis]